MNKKGKSTLKICEQKLNYLNYSENTINCYLHYIDKFLKSQVKSAKHLNSTDFQLYFENHNFTSISQQNQIINAIRFLYKFGLNKKYNKVSFKRPKKEKKLPKIIDGELIRNRLQNIENLKHKMILTLTYSVGLRVSEVVNLKIKDIDFNRMLIYIRNAKGKKDRIVPLSKNVYKLLKTYYKIYKPKEYIFNGQGKIQYSISSCQRIYKKYIDQNSSFHTLRHSTFTNLLENGCDLRIIQKLAGHNSSKTTEIYTHVSNRILKTVKLPI